MEAQVKSLYCMPTSHDSFFLPKVVFSAICIESLMRHYYKFNIKNEDDFFKYGILSSLILFKKRMPIVGLINIQMGLWGAHQISLFVVYMTHNMLIFVIK